MSVSYQSTATQTDYVTSTIYATPTANGMSSATNANSDWDYPIRRYLPALIAFAIIGLLTVIGILIYLAYRFFQAKSRKVNAGYRFSVEDHQEKYTGNQKSNSPISTTISNIIPWLSISSPRHPTDKYVDYQPKQREPIRYDQADLQKVLNINDEENNRRPSLAPSWLTKLLPNKRNTGSTKRHQSLPIIFTKPNTIDNLNVPISSTFVPIDKSSLTLVPRSEIWQDPTRRRGVDELDMWEKRKNSNGYQTLSARQSSPLIWKFPNNQYAYPDSPESSRQVMLERHSIQNDHTLSQQSSTTTVQDTSESGRYDDIQGPSNSQNVEGQSITVKLPKSKQQNDINLVRQELEQSKLKNSSSQWLYPSESRKSF